MYKYLRIETKMVRKRICWLSSIWKLVIGVAHARQKLPHTSMKFIMNLTSKIHQTRRVMSSALPSSELILLLTIASIVTLPSLQVIFMICLLYCCFQCFVIIVVLGVSVYKIPLKLYAPTHHCSSLDSVNPAPMFLPLLSRHVDQFMERDNAIHFHFRH